MVLEEADTARKIEAEGFLWRGSGEKEEPLALLTLLFPPP
jgi:hypothetical protein